MRKTQAGGSSLRRKVFSAGLGFLVLVLLVTSFFGKKGVVDLRRARRELRSLQADVSRLEEDRRRLERELAELRRNPRAVELEAREKLGLVKPGEVVIVTPRRKDPPKK
ncbi:MAG: septum formation initiator family protein [Candidatus Aminicenantes bacterium]|nr:septum formation initiator family protein [Candidatus Aminicenantes bacterium]